MHHFAYRRGVSHANVLHAEEVDLCALADTVGTPFYCYSTATLERHYKVFTDAFAARPDTLVCYSIKANSNLGVLATLAKLGAGMDVVSEGELRRALAVGVPGERIAFSGIGKTKEEMAFALDAGIFAFNVESEPELRALSQVADARGITARIAFRVNPDVDALTHHKISTGKAENKFGVPFEQALSLYRQAATLPGIAPAGVHMHIGSQITDLAPLDNAFALMAELVGILRDKGHEIEFVNTGGGLGVPYRYDNEPPPRPELYAETVRRKLAGLDCRILFEPGRMIAANAGILVTRVIYEKNASGRRIVIVDAAMNDLIRPTLYDAWHEIWPVSEAARQKDNTPADLVGPICETSDRFAKDRPLPPLSRGDLVALMTAGAYGAVQSSSYNSRLLIPEVLVNGEEWAIVRARPSYDEMLKPESLPSWLSDR